MRKSLMLAVACVLLYPNSSAQAGGQTCRELQDSISENGAVILRYPSSTAQAPRRYDRFVADQSECPAHYETLKVRRLPALDTDACPAHVCWSDD